MPRISNFHIRMDIRSRHRCEGSITNTHFLTTVFRILYALMAVNHIEVRMTNTEICILTGSIYSCLECGMVDVVKFQTLAACKKGLDKQHRIRVFPGW